VIDVKHVVPLTLLAQFCVGLAVAGVAGVWFDATAGVSALLGAATAVIPNGFLAARLIASNRDPSDHAMLKAARIGATGKLLLTAALFAVIFGFVRPLAPLAVFVGFIAAQLTVYGAFLMGDGAPRSEAVTKS
jgi:ATP synthase protein I